MRTGGGITPTPPTTCGDGVVDPSIGETCDPPGSPGGGNGNLCGPECTSCGDGISGLHEECDDGNGINTDSCTNDCRWNLCGNGTIDSGETCDPPGSPAGGNGNTCRASCTSCGDGMVNNGEACDDGNGVDSDSCRNNCTRPPVCGDGVVNTSLGETCDPPGSPAGGNGNTCRADCTSCGDSMVNNGEACDDGNGVDSDSCRNNCTRPPVCGDGVVNTSLGETCDPPGSPAGGNGNTCRANCTSCGDSMVNNGEACDDGNGVDSDNCRNNCTLPPVCVTNVDCDDDEICTTDTCVAGACQNVVAPGSVCLCAELDCPTVGHAANITTSIDGNGDVTVVFVESADINDNSYGTNRVTWPRDHKFGDLVGSDKAEFSFRNGNGQVVFNFYLDYITKQTGTPSGYGSLGVSGGDGKVNLGQAAWLMSWSTSLAENLNATGYCAAANCTVAGVNLLVNSPPTSPANTGYGLPPAFSQWKFPITYTVKVSHLAFGASGFGGVSVPTVHNSPPKCGDNATNFDECPCSGSIGDFVWNDLNEDGLQNAGEPGLPGVDLTLTDGNAAIVGQATTDASGLYQFTGICPGSYAVEVDPTSLPPGFSPTTPCGVDQSMPTDSNCQPAAVDLPTDGTSNDTIDFGYVGPPVVPCGSDADCADLDPCTTDRCVGGVCLHDSTSGGGCLCAFSDCPNVIPAGTITTAIDASGDVTIVFTESTSINDNSYGLNKVNWGRSHSFSDLVGSDKAQFVLTNAAGAVVLNFYMDYISRSTGAPSGYASLGVIGGEGAVTVGQAAWIMSWQTSIAANLNTTGYCAAGSCTVSGVNLLVNSPPTSPNTSYNLPPAFSQWKFPISYTVKVSHLAFGASGFGGVTVPSLHNSPPKCGDNVTTFGPCSSALGGSPNASDVSTYQPPVKSGM